MNFFCTFYDSRNVVEEPIEKGLASAIRHKRDDANRPQDHYKLMAAEQTYVRRILSCSWICLLTSPVAL